jgi:uncharacterized damage-inducible protein DinB
MSRAAINEWIYLFNSAFDGNEQSVLKNLESVSSNEWAVLPEGGQRSILDIVAHIGMFKFMYPGAAFREREFDYADDPVHPPASRLATKESAVEWLKQAHAYLIDAFSELTDDTELDVLRAAHWGAMVPTRRLMATVLEHDTYHAGEINHARALLQKNDEWE